MPTGCFFPDGGPDGTGFADRQLHSHKIEWQRHNDLGAWHFSLAVLSLDFSSLPPRSRLHLME